MDNRTALTDMRELLKSAAYMCESYADFIKREVKAADIEQHPYLPELEGVAEDIREALAALASREASPAPLTEALTHATAALAGAASAYRTYARRHASQGKSEVDPFFSTRVSNMDKAVERARAALASPQVATKD